MIGTKHKSKLKLLSQLPRLHRLIVHCYDNQQIFYNTIRSICPNVANINIRVIEKSEFESSDSSESDSESTDTFDSDSESTDSSDSEP